LGGDECVVPDDCAVWLGGDEGSRGVSALALAGVDA
jgi:hypothetical protein